MIAKGSPLAIEGARTMAATAQSVAGNNGPASIPSKEDDDLTVISKTKPVRVVVDTEIPDPKQQAERKLARAARRQQYQNDHQANNQAHEYKGAESAGSDGFDGPPAAKRGPKSMTEQEQTVTKLMGTLSAAYPQHAQQVAFRLTQESVETLQEIVTDTSNTKLAAQALTYSIPLTDAQVQEGLFRVPEEVAALS